MINNLEILKPILHFEKDYYVRVIILSRLKDGHSTQKRICKDLFFGSFESLKETMPDIIKVAEEYYARVYIDTVSKRLSSGFLSQIEWERFKVFGIKPQLKDIIINEDFYGLYDADEYSENANKGEHWLYKISELYTMLDKIEDNYIRNKIFIGHAWACLYNPCTN